MKCEHYIGLKTVLTLAALEIELGEFRPISWPRMRFISSVVPFVFRPPTAIQI